MFIGLEVSTSSKAPSGAACAFIYRPEVCRPSVGFACFLAAAFYKHLAPLEPIIRLFRLPSLRFSGFLRPS